MATLEELANRLATLQTEVQTLRTENTALTEENRDQQQPGQAIAPPHEFKFHGINPPTHLNLFKGNRGETWKLWKQQWNNYSTLSKLSTASREEQVALFQSCLGLDALKTYNQLNLPNEPTLTNIIAKFDELLICELNETYERYCFNLRVQHPDEPVDSFISDLSDLAKSCGFCKCLHDTLIRDRIVMGLQCKDTQKLLLAVKQLTLDDCIDKCRAAEATAKRVSSIQSTPAEVHRIKTRKSSHTSSSSSSSSSSRKSSSKISTKKCRYCDTTHEMLKSKCPAYGKKCSMCGGWNHFAVKCRKNKHHVHAIQEESHAETDSDLETISVVNVVTTKQDTIYAELLICDEPVRIQIDCGATVNVLPQSLAGDSQITSTSTLLQMWNKAVAKPLGEFKVPVCNPVTGQKFRCKFVIVPDEQGFIPLLGSKVSQKMGLITVNSDQFKQVAAVTKPCDPIKTYPEVFNDDLGLLPGEVSLSVDDSITPQISPDRRVLEALKEKLKSELNNLCDLKVITPVNAPTDWVNNIVVATKKSGDLRVCINPQALNKALKRERYQLPILEDFLPSLAQAKVFTTLDLKAGYWHVLLDEQSSFLTTFSTPYGRYRFLHLPFGCNVSSEIFQRKLNEAIGDLPGVLCVADDIMLYGTGDTESEAIQDHDVKLSALLKRCQELGIRLNKSKLKLRQRSVNFLGHLVTTDGLKPDPAKCQAIDEMPPPEDKNGVQRLNGFVNYLACWQSSYLSSQT